MKLPGNALIVDDANVGWNSDWVHRLDFVFFTLRESWLANIIHVQMLDTGEGRT
ncbi:hypothetical protein ACYSUW_13615 [Pseudomonas frederiksbergensis]